MHLIGLNIPDIFVKLWRGTIACGASDSKSDWTWTVLVVMLEAAWCSVAAVLPYLPGSFDRPPRNPAEKINSGYKAWEFVTGSMGMVQHCCMTSPLHVLSKLLQLFVFAYLSHSISRSDCRLHISFSPEFCEDFETLYCQRGQIVSTLFPILSTLSHISHCVAHQDHRCYKQVMADVRQCG